jgi:RNA polymerase sigma-70 factor, ECF subfamily
VDQHAFDEFYGREARSLWSYAYRVVGNAFDADDIVQDTFLRVLRADISALDNEGRHRYAIRVASNLITDRWRRSAREQAGLARFREEPLQRGSEQASDDVSRTFAALKPRERALLWLAYVEGEDHQSIAGALGIARGSVKVLVAGPNEAPRSDKGDRSENNRTMRDLSNRRVSAQDETDVTAFMKRLATASPPRPPALPEAEVLWLKAQLLRRWEVEQKVQIPLDIMEPVQLSAGFVLAGLLLVWSLPCWVNALPSIVIGVFSM